RFGRFDLDMPMAQLRAMPELSECADALAPASGRADCTLPRAADSVARIQLAWEETRTGGEIVALRLIFDPQLAPALTEFEWQLARGWGPPTPQPVRPHPQQKVFTVECDERE